ncbi:MAG: GDYXXLXY domain-containing protein [Planctomycetota bacterium]|jgi:uncharacterized membrane-anchored protein
MRKLLIICAVVFQILLLAFMAGQREYVLRKGKSVYLQTNPIDPRDYFRGDYVRLTYEISNIKSEKLRDGLKLLEKDRQVRDKKVYVVLQVDDKNVANILYATDKKPKKEQLFIRGRLNYKSHDHVNVRYGIESYFVEQGKGKELEERKIKGHRALLEMEIALGASGIAGISGYRWGPISIEIVDLQLKDNLPQSAKLTLTNISENPVAIVDLPGNRSLKMEKDLRGWWWDEDENWRWMNEDAPASSPENEDVHVLEPDQGYELVVDFNDPYWSISLNNKDAILVSKYGFRRSPFRIVYEPPSAQQCKNLKDADLIWHGRISSESIPNRD